VARWQPLGGGCALVLTPHPDDETLGCGGSLIHHHRAGDKVRVIQVTDGRASRAGGLGPDEMARRREAEAREAMATLEVDLVWLGFPEDGWREHELLGPLSEQMADAQPAVIYAPSPIDYHPEHLRVARVLADIVTTPVRVYELGVPLGADLTNLVADTTSVEPLRRAALAAYRTQTLGTSNLRRLRRYAGAYWQGGGVAEPFWEISAEAFRAVVASARTRSVQFRGLRGRAFGDPLSYLVGRTERRRLARLAASVPGPEAARASD
jgi:LmbE family N-acetylglucosaminyl deacetylase